MKYLDSIESLDAQSLTVSSGGKLTYQWQLIQLNETGSRLTARFDPLVAPFNKHELLILGGFDGQYLGDGYILNTNSMTLDQVITQNSSNCKF